MVFNTIFEAFVDVIVSNKTTMLSSKRPYIRGALYITGKTISTLECHLEIQQPS